MKQPMLKFSAVILKEGKWYIARCPELQVTSQGKSFEKAMDNLKEAVELYIESFGANDFRPTTDPPIWTSLEIAPHHG